MEVKDLLLHLRKARAACNGKFPRRERRFCKIEPVFIAPLYHSGTVEVCSADASLVVGFTERALIDEASRE